jgi:hypothetical protein
VCEVECSETRLPVGISGSSYPTGKAKHIRYMLTSHEAGADGLADERRR